MIKRMLAVLAMLGACLGSAQAQNQPEIFPQLGHSGFVTSVSFSPDGRILASGSWDQTIKLWDLASGRELRTLIGHTDHVLSVAFSPDGRVLASGSRDGTVNLWDTVSWRELRILRVHPFSAVNALAFSPDGRTLALATGDFVSREFSTPSTVKLWDVASGRELLVLSGHANDVGSVAFSPDGSMLASGSSDKTVKLWDVASGRELRTLNGHSAQVESVAFSADGKVLASGGDDKTVMLWDVASGSKLRTLSGHTDHVHSVAFSPGGTVLASGSRDGTVKLWDTVSWRELHTLALAGDFGVTSVRFSPDGSLLASALASFSSDHEIKLWDVTSGNALRTFGGHSAWVNSVEFSPDGSKLASGSSDKTVNLWDAATAHELGTIRTDCNVSSVAFSPDGGILASGCWDKTVKLWDVASRRKLLTLSGHSEGVKSVAFSPDGHTLASSSVDDTVKLWDVASGRELHTLSGPFGLFTNVNTAAFSPDGRTLASNDSGTIKLWDVVSGLELRSFEPSNVVMTVAFSPDGHVLATGEIGDANLWDVATGHRLRTLTGHRGVVVSVAFSPDGKVLASGSWDNTVKLWDVASGRELRTLSGHSAGVTSVAFSPDGKTLASGSQDGTTREWDISSGKERVSFVTFEDGSYLVITPQGYYDASSAKAEENLNVRVGNRVFPIAAYRKEFYRPELVKRAMAGESLKELGFAGIDGVKLAPIVELVDLPSSINESKLTVNVRITDGGGGIGEVRLWLNGTAVAAQQPSPGRAQISLSFTVQLPSGPNGLQAEADNAASTMHANSAMHQIIATLPRAPHGKLYALVVGIKEFKYPKLNNLEYPIADAHLIAETLEKYSAPLFQEKPNITLLTTPEQTTRNSLIHALKMIKTVIGADDVFVFYVASHGDIVDGKYFLATSNVDSADRFAAQALSEDDLTSLLADIPAPKKLILIDTCHTPVGDSRGYNDKTAVRKMGREIGVTMLGAATTNQEAIEEVDANGHGLFTFVVADGLSGSARVSDGMVTNLALIDYVADVVSRIAKERYNHEQNPPVDVNGERFPLTKVR